MDTNEIKNKQQATLVLKLFNLFRFTYLSRNQSKIVDNIKPLKRIILNRFPEFRIIIPKLPENAAESKLVLKKILLKVNSDYDTAEPQDKVNYLFKEVYSTVTKILFSVSAAGAAGTALVASLQSPFVLFPLTIMCTLSVFVNAKSHGITFRQSLINFRKSFDYFIKKHEFTKKEKKLAYVPLFLVSLGLFLSTLKYMKQPAVKRAAQSGIDIIKTLQNKSTRDLVSLIKIDVKKTKVWLQKITLMDIFWCWTAATIIYLLLSVLDQWILRKGEYGNADEI